MINNFLNKMLFQVFTFGTLVLNAQTYSCVRNISTNPVNPYNDEWGTMFPNDPGSFINDASNGGFSWYYNPYFPIVIDPTQQPWTVPFNTPISMWWPFDQSNGVDLAYLWDVAPEEERDFLWEDGWELLWMNLGITPNGTPINQKTPDMWWPNSEPPSPTSVPYFVLYNRYRGTLRIFANVWFDQNDHWDDITVSLRFIDQSQDNGEVSGILRHTGGLDKALDQPTDVVEIKTPRKQRLPDYPQWYAADFQLGYDPCQCQIPSKMELVFRVTNMLLVDLETRSISIEKDITKLNYDEKNFLQYDAGEAGNVVYKSMDALLDDYNKLLDKYNNELEDYNNPINQLKKSAIDMLKVGVGQGVANLSIPVGALKQFMLNNQIKLWDDSLVTPKDESQAEQWATALKNNMKKGVAEEFDFLNVLLDVQEKPVRPQVPVATFAEGRIKGKITGEKEVFSSPLFVPGTIPTAYNGIPTNIRSANFPAYNNVPGLFALLKAPKIKLYKENNETTYDYGLIINEIRPVLNTHIYFMQYSADLQTTDKTYLQLEGSLDYVLNPALDFDMDKTKILVSFQIEYEKENFASHSVNNLYTQVSETSNYKLLHRFLETPNAQTTKVTTLLSSEFYDINSIKNILFGSELSNTLSITGEFEHTTYHGDNIFNDPERWIYVTNKAEELIEENLIYLRPSKIKSIKMKIAADMYFDQLGYNDEQVNTFQVFTYSIYDSEKDGEIDIALPNAGNQLVNEYGSWVKYVPGTVSLSSTISNSSPEVFEQVGNKLYVRAENILIDGVVGPASGYELYLEGLNRVTVLPGGKTLPETLAYTKEFYYNGLNPLTPVDLVQDFCSSNYSAGHLSQKALVKKILPKTPKVDPKLLIKAFPNPTADFIKVSLTGLPSKESNVELILMSIEGKKVVSKKEKIFASGLIYFDLPKMADGVYLLRIVSETDEIETIQKVIIQN